MTKIDKITMSGIVICASIVTIVVALKVWVWMVRWACGCQ